MKIKRCIILFFITAIVNGIALISCSDDNDSAGKDFMRFTVKGQAQNYKLADSLFQRCELHIGSSDKFIFAYDQTFKSPNTDFYSITIDIDCSSEHCPETTLDNTCQFSLDLAKQNASKKFIDYTSKPSLNVAWSQRYQNSSIIVTGTFEGYLYQYFQTRPSGGEVAPAPMLLDSVYVEKGEFQVSLPH